MANCWLDSSDIVVIVKLEYRAKKKRFLQTQQEVPSSNLQSSNTKKITPTNLHEYTIIIPQDKCQVTLSSIQITGPDSYSLSPPPLKSPKMRCHNKKLSNVQTPELVLAVLFCRL